MSEEEFESTRRRMQRLIEDVASLENGESERALSFNTEKALEDPRLVEILELKRDMEYRLFKAEEERDRERERAELLSAELDELHAESTGARDKAIEEAKTTRVEFEKERERREYLEKRLISVEREGEGAKNLFESESQRLRDANERLEAESTGLRLSRREEQEQLQGQVRDLEGRYWKSQAEWEGERSRLETLLSNSEEKARTLEDSVNSLSAFETRCRELEDQLRAGISGNAIPGIQTPETDTVLPPVDPVLDPAWRRVAQYLESPMAAAYAHLKRFSGARLGDGHRALLKMTAGEIVRAQDALKALRHLLEADSETVEVGRPEKIIDAVLSAWEPSLRRRGITVLRRMEPTSAGMRYAPEALRTAVYHLIRNAYEAMPHGGNLTVSTEKVPSGDAVIFRFQDTGPGFTPERLNDPFTPFRTERSNRLGIGLAIASAAMLAGGGEAEISNGKEGGGVATLRFSTPTTEIDDAPSLTGEPKP